VVGVGGKLSRRWLPVLRSEGNQSELVFAMTFFDCLREEEVPDSCKVIINMPKLPIGIHPAWKPIFYGFGKWGVPRGVTRAVIR